MLSLTPSSQFTLCISLPYSVFVEQLLKSFLILIHDQSSPIDEQMTLMRRLYLVNKKPSKHEYSLIHEQITPMSLFFLVNQKHTT